MTTIFIATLIYTSYAVEGFGGLAALQTSLRDRPYTLDLHHLAGARGLVRRIDDPHDRQAIGAAGSRPLAGGQAAQEVRHLAIIHHLRAVLGARRELWPQLGHPIVALEL